MYVGGGKLFVWGLDGLSLVVHVLGSQIRHCVHTHSTCLRNFDEMQVNFQMQKCTLQIQE
jgi:hypothetical protein